MRIMIAHRGQYAVGGEIMETYALSMIRTLRDKGHEVIEAPKTPPKAPEVYKGIDLLLDIDCGRDEKGHLRWHGEDSKPPVLSAVYLIDSHGHPTIHRRLAKRYDHVFFAVWDKRDLFANHVSAHWCPNFTDIRWFNGANFGGVDFSFDFGFFGTKGGLDRTDPMIRLANNHGWVPCVKEIGRNGKQRWPGTAQHMSMCRNLFNHGQKHDGPNLRVMESMLMKRPLITDQDPRSGMDKLFIPGKHYLPYEAYTYKGLEEIMMWCMKNLSNAQQIAYNAYEEVKVKHLVGNRLDQILEVVNG